MDLIFLTGTINTNGIAFVKLSDPVIRQKQYIDNINFYLKNSKLKILFVENSATDISSYFKKEIENNRIEILTFAGNEFDGNLGKGYGEMSIIEYSLLHSKFMKNARNIYKNTGRLKVLNFNYFDNYYNKIDEKIISVYLNDKNNFCDSRFFVANLDFYTNYLVTFKSQINDTNEINFEHVLSKAALKYIIDNANSFIQFPTIPRIAGVCGSDGVTYNSNIFFWLMKHLVYKIKTNIFKQ